MGTFFGVLLVVFVQQIVFLFTFSLSVSIYVDLFYITSILPIFYLISHFKYSNKICMTLGLSKNKFNIYYFVCWVLMIFLNFFSLDFLIEYGIIAASSGWFSGMEYVFYFFLLVVYIIILYSLKLLVFIISKLIIRFNKK